MNPWHDLDEPALTYAITKCLFKFYSGLQPGMVIYFDSHCRSILFTPLKNQSILSFFRPAALMYSYKARSSTTPCPPPLVTGHPLRQRPAKALPILHKLWLSCRIRASQCCYVLVSWRDRDIYSEWTHRPVVFDKGIFL